MASYSRAYPAPLARRLAISEVLADGFWDGLDLDTPRVPPAIDVYEAAHRFGARVEVTPRISEDGRLEDTPRTTRILLRAEAVAERRRFTLAHELGHLVLNDPDLWFAAVKTLGREPNLEQVCDDFAAELLMPHRWVRDSFGNSPESFAVIDAFVRSAQVSLSAAMTRLGVVLDWRSTLFYFDRTRRWTPVAIAGRQRRTAGLRITGSEPQLLADVHEGRVDTLSVIALEVNRRPVWLHGVARASRGGVLCLGTFSDRRSRDPYG